MISSSPKDPLNFAAKFKFKFRLCILFNSFSFSSLSAKSNYNEEEQQHKPPSNAIDRILLRFRKLSDQNDDEPIRTLLPNNFLNREWIRSESEKEVEQKLLKKKKKKKKEVTAHCLAKEELSQLRAMGIHLKEKISIPKSGLTRSVLQRIHHQWNTNELVKLKFHELLAQNMNLAHHIVQRRTGGLVIWRSGSVMWVYRGKSYQGPTNGNQLESKGGDEKSESVVLNQQQPENMTPEEAEFNRMLDDFGPRFVDWWGTGILPIDADLLLPTIPGYRTPLRILPARMHPRLTNDEHTKMLKLAKALPCHFALGRNRNLQGLACAILKLWEKSLVAKIAVKLGVQNTNNELMALELQNLELQKEHRYVAESVEQCPILDDFVHMKLGLSFPWKAYVTLDSALLSDLVNVLLRGKVMRVCAIVDNVNVNLSSLIKGCCLVLIGIILSHKLSGFCLLRKNQKQKVVKEHPPAPQKRIQHCMPGHSKATGWRRKKLLVIFMSVGILGSAWLFRYMSSDIAQRREEMLATMCDERARMLQDQFNVSMNHVHALAILVSTFHHGKHPSAVDQKIFGEYTESSAFERPLTSGVAYALKVLHSDRMHFEKQHGWTIKKMETENEALVQECIPENLDPAPIQDEYAPVVFAQETVSHIVSIDMMSGKEDRENILRARASGKGVLTSPFKLLKSNYLGVVLTFAVYDSKLPPDATPEQRIEATVGYLGASYDVPSLVDKLLHQLACQQTIAVNVYDTTNASDPITMYGTDVLDTGLLHVSGLDFGDPLRKHEMHCRFKHMPPFPWTAFWASLGVFVITFLLGYIFYAAINRIAKVEDDYCQMRELKVRAEAADVAKSQFLATVSHEIRTPMNGVLGMLQMLMDTDLDDNQMDFAQTAHTSGKDLISVISEVLYQAKIEAGKLELEAVAFHPHAILDEVLSLFSEKSDEKGIELAVYASNQVPEVVIGDPKRFRQIITNLVGNSLKFIHNKGHVFVSIHLANEVKSPLHIMDAVLRECLNLNQDMSERTCNTLSGFPVGNRWKSWEKFQKLNLAHESETIQLLVTVEDTGIGIPTDAQSRIFTPFMQADSSTSRTYGGTGIGLSISKCLVDLMGGEIGFVSEPEIGSTFSFTGNFRKGETESVDEKWQKNNPLASEFQGLRALVIDRRKIRAEVTRYHLQRLGMSVDVNSSLQSACFSISDTCNSSMSTQLAMILIDKDSWDKESSILYAIKKQGQNGVKGDSLNFPKIFLLATHLSPNEQKELKSVGIIDDVLMKPLWQSVLIRYYRESLGTGRKQIDRKKVSQLENLLIHKRILVVDDNAVNRKVAEGVLRKYGAVVTCVEGGKAALKVLKPPHNFDACFMDLQMPEMDGFEVTRLIRYMENEVNEKIACGEELAEMFGNISYWHIPILAMTADVTQASNEECKKCGMDDFVSKPFEEEQLYTAVARVFSFCSQ